MKTKLVPLALLIPAVVLAQPAPPPPLQGGMPPAIAMPAPPANPAKAAAALNTAKELSSELNRDSYSSALTTSGSSGTGGSSCACG